MKFLSVIYFLILVSSGIGDFVKDPKISDLGRGVVAEILTILTKGVLKVAGECSEPLPWDIKFYLYTRNTIQDPVELYYYDPFQIDTNKRVIVIIHGYISDIQAYGFQDLKHAYLERYDCNVIIVDWNKHAWGLYTTSVCILPKIASLVGDFLCRLNQLNFYDLQNIHLVGHSLGAQMAGLSGQSVQTKCKQTLGRITGLDPAGPLYLGRPVSERLNSEDATFVDVIHTNGGVFGYYTSVGHVDFFPNCGVLQFCKPFELSFNGIMNLPVSVVTCHHIMSLDYMSEGVRTDNFKGIPCKGCPLPMCPPIFRIFDKDKPIMGENCPNTTRGNYFVPVGYRSPFAIRLYRK